MKIMRSFDRRKFMVGFLWLHAFLAHAGGPLVVVANRAVVYRDSAFPLTWRLDAGTLGLYSRNDAVRLVQEAFRAWEDLPTATPSFSRGEDLPADITVSNYMTYWGKFADGINPVLLDSDGEIIEAIRGVGAKNNVVGLAVSAYFTSGPNAGFFAESEVLINGALSDKTSFNQYLGVIKHEIGHLLGLDHAQFNQHEALDGIDTNDNVAPLMFPISTSNANFAEDDLHAISLLYPGEIYFNERGTLRGTIRRREGTLARGANVVAINVANSVEQYSTVTDYLGNAPGVYEFRGLPAGNYFVLAEPVVENFYGGSGVGPYTRIRSDLAFINAVPFEYYNGADESHDPFADRPEDAVVVSVSANGVTENIDFLANDLPGQTLDRYFSTKAAFFYAIGMSHPHVAAAVRFTPRVSGKLLWIRLFINGGKDAIKGNDMMRFSIARPSSVDRNLPGDVIDQIAVPVQSLNRGVLIPHEIWVGDRNIAVTAAQDFFIVAEVDANSAAQLLFDDGVTTRALRSSLKTRGGAWQPASQLFTNANNLMMAAAIGGVSTEAPPLQFTLEQNFPNPLVIKSSGRAQTVFRFILPQETRVELSIFDRLGREVRQLTNTVLPAGYNIFFWDGREANGLRLATGIYFYRLRAGNSEEIKKLVLMH